MEHILLNIVIAIFASCIIISPYFTKKISIFEPIVFVSFMYFIYYGIGPLVIFFSGGHIIFGKDVEPYFFIGSALSFISYVSLFIGYFILREGSKTQQIQLDYKEMMTIKRVGIVLFFVCTAGMFLYALFLGISVVRLFLPWLFGYETSLNMGSGMRINYLGLLIDSYLASICCFILVFINMQKKNKIMWGILIFFASVVVLGFYLTQAFRYRVVLFLFTIIMVYCYGRNISKPPIKIIATMLIVIFLIIGFMEYNRGFLRGLAGFSPITKKEILRAGIGDLKIYSTMLSVVEYVPKYEGFVHFEPFYYAAILPIPRAVWEGKPYPNYLSVINRSFGSIEGLFAGAAVPNVGEQYMMFGVIGVAVISFIVGLVLALVWNRFCTKGYRLHSIILYFLFLSTLFIYVQRGYLAQYFQTLFFSIVPFWVTRQCLKQKSSGRVV